MEELRRTRLPSLRSTATVSLVVGFARVDQMTELVVWSRMTRLPSPEMASSGEEGSTTGLSPLALQSGLSFGTLLNHMPRYVLGCWWCGGRA